MTCRLPFALLALLACTPQPGTTSDPSSDPSTTTANTPTATTDNPVTTTDDPTTATTANTATTAATATTGDPTSLYRCTPTCSEDNQPCRIDGFATNFLCVAGICELSACNNDEVCRLRGAGWGDTCLDQSMCPDPAEACVEYNGEGRCAPLESDMFSCADLGLVAVQLTPTEGGRSVTVCADQSSTCVDNNCFTPCKADTDCPPQLGQPHCQVATGLCTCSGDDECLASGQPGLVVCDAGTCGCTVDADCSGGKNVDTCIDGACGCSSTTTCTDPVFDNATQLCQPA